MLGALFALGGSLSQRIGGQENGNHLEMTQTHIGERLKDSLCVDLGKNCYFLVMPIFDLEKTILKVLLNLKRGYYRFQ
jgi:hypothetical protein